MSLIGYSEAALTAMICARDVSIEFPIFESSHRSLKKTIINLSTGGKIGKDVAERTVVTALDGLNFEFHVGSKVGLVGHNGSGKTTLLRMLSGVYAPVRGEIFVRGRVASLLDVSMGLDLDATGFENIYLRGIMDGQKPSLIRGRIDEIAEFSELGDYLNLPVRTYSSGMMLRLAFAISTSVKADILLMDEWLSVGDKEFSVKAQKRLEEMVDQASILVIASHDSRLIDSLCNRKITLSHGKIIQDSVLSA